MHTQSTSLSRLSGFLVGALVGGVVGTTVMLLAAPQSGRRTRALLQKKGLEMQAQVADKVDETRSWAESAWWDTLLKLQHLKREALTKAQELQYQTQLLLEEQMERVAGVIDGPKSKEKAKTA